MYIFKRISVLVLIFLMAFTFNSCDDGKLGDPIIISNVEKEFYFDIWEELSDGNRYVHFLVETIEDGACLNGTITYDFSSIGNKLNLVLKEVVTPEDCVTGTAPSVADIDIGNLQYNLYTFEFSLRNEVVNTGRLSISDKRYRLFLETEEGIIILHNTLYRVPENTFWGYIGYEELEDETAVNEVFSDLMNIGELPVLDKGYYGYFDINSSEDGIEIKDSPLSTHLKPFIFSYDGNWANIKSIAENFLISHPSVTFKLFGDKGEVF